MNELQREADVVKVEVNRLDKKIDELIEMLQSESNK